MNEPIPLERPEEAPEAEPVPLPAIAARELYKTYVGGDGSALHVLDNAELIVNPSEVVAIIGESGSGKSTLLHLLGGLDMPTSGDVSIGGQPLRKLSEDELSRTRNEKVGFKIREHTLQRVPYLLVAGDREAGSHSLAVRTRNGKDLGAMSVDTIAARLAEEVASRGRTVLEV